MSKHNKKIELQIRKRALTGRTKKDVKNKDGKNKYQIYKNYQKIVGAQA